MRRHQSGRAERPGGRRIRPLSRCARCWPRARLDRCGIAGWRKSRAASFAPQVASILHALSARAIVDRAHRPGGFPDCDAVRWAGDPDRHRDARRNVLSWRHGLGPRDSGRLARGDLPKLDARVFLLASLPSSPPPPFPRRHRRPHDAAVPWLAPQRHRLSVNTTGPSPRSAILASNKVTIASRRLRTA